jgi:hypothetical protein
MLGMLLMAAVGPSAAELSALETRTVAKGATVRTNVWGHSQDLGPRVQARNVQCAQIARGRFSCSFESRRSNGPFKDDFGAWTPRQEVLAKDGLGGWRIEPRPPAP